MLIEDRVDVHGAFPNAMEVFQSVTGFVDLELYSLKKMLQYEFSTVLKVGVHDRDLRTPHIGEIREELLLNLRKSTAFNLVGIRVGVVTELEHLVLAAEIESQELVDKRKIVVDSSDLKDLLAAHSSTSVPMQLVI